MEENKKEILQIRLHVYDTEIPVKVPRDEEALYRNAAILITNTLNTYSQYYKGRISEKEMWYMVLIEIALRYEKEATRNDTTPYSDILTKLTSEIEQALKSEK